MAEETIPGKGWIVIGLVFLAFVVVHLRWGGEANQNGNGSNEPFVASIRIANEDGVMEITPAASATAAALAALTEGRIRLLLNGSATERRATAVELASLTCDAGGRGKLAQLPAETLLEVRRALLGKGRKATGLNDPDPVVSASCRQALEGLWRMSGSAVGDDYLQQGLAAFEADRIDKALEVFRQVEQLGGTVPPDLYRLQAEAYLAKARPDEALTACAKALRADACQFLALHAMARAYVQMHEIDKADKALTVALEIYHEFPEAHALRAQIQSQPPSDATP